MFRQIIQVLAILWPVAVTAEVRFEFELPPFAARELAGESALLVIEADNGYPIQHNQSYRNTDITAVSLVLNEREIRFGEASQISTRGEAVYITTDADGVPTLSLSETADSYLRGTLPETGQYVQLATRDGYGPTPLVLRDGPALGMLLDPELTLGGASNAEIDEMPSAGTFLVIALVLVWLGFMAHGKEKIVGRF